MAPRRSRRLASQEPEIEQDIDTIPIPKRTRKAAKWDVKTALLRIFAGNSEAYVRELTAEKRKAVIEGMRTQTIDLTTQNTDLTSQNADLQDRLQEVSRERDQARAILERRPAGSKLRDAAMRAQIDAIVEERKRKNEELIKAEAHTSPNKQIATDAPESTPADTQQLVTAENTHTPDTTATATATASTPRSYWGMLNPLKLFSRTPQPQPTQPLGELTPASRKRTAPAQQPVPEPKQAQTEPRPTYTQRPDTNRSSNISRFRQTIDEQRKQSSTPLRRRTRPERNTATNQATAAADADTNRPAKRQRAIATEDDVFTSSTLHTNTQAQAQTDADTRPAKSGPRNTTQREPAPQEQQSTSRGNFFQAQEPGDADSRPANRAPSFTTGANDTPRPARSQYTTQARGPGAADSRPANLDRRMTTQSQPSAHESTSTSLGAITPASRKRAAPSAFDQVTPSTQKTPHMFVLPSTKNRAVPSSLSTVTEYTEDSFIPGTTPSRKFAWERSGRVRETNADARWNKMERYRQLKAELHQMSMDSEIKEMESHRVKRVKVDKLVSIPHRRPDDSEGTFRVPDIDSEDEMIVGEDCEEVVNLFEMEAAKPHQQSEFVFPSVGKRAAGEVCNDEEGAKEEFAFGLQMWKERVGL